eukprot:1008862-Prymnesium_polylepis.1
MPFVAVCSTITLTSLVETAAASMLRNGSASAHTPRMSRGRVWTYARQAVRPSVTARAIVERTFQSSGLMSTGPSVKCGLSAKAFLRYAWTMSGVTFSSGSHVGSYFLPVFGSMSVHGMRNSVTPAFTRCARIGSDLK